MKKILIVIVCSFAFFLGFSDTGLHEGAIFDSLAHGGEIPWNANSTSETNAQTEDGDKAEVDADGDVTSYLTVTDFGFSVPANSTINGVVVNVVWGMAGGGDLSYQESVRLNVNTAWVGDDKSTAAQIPSGGYSLTQFGGASDTWGVALTPTIVNSGLNFGVGVAITAGGGNDPCHDGGGPCSCGIDFIGMTVYYTESSGVKHHLIGHSGQKPVDYIDAK